MKDRRHVKVIIPCANEGEWLRVTVDSILAVTRYHSYEILITANGDTRTDFSFLERPSCRGRVRLKAHPEFLGVGNARNAGVRKGDAAYYVFLDGHCLIEQPDWLERAVASLESRPDASMIQPEIVEFVYQDEIAPGADLDPSRVKRVGPLYSVRWSWPYVEAWQLTESQRHRLSPHPYEAMSGSGGVIFLRADTFHRLGKFDPEVIGWFHETLDYCVRAWMLGHPMIADPTITVLHRVKEEKSLYPRMYVHIFQGALRTAYKYLSPRRRDLAELVPLRHGKHAEMKEALELLHRGNWLQERVRHLRERVHDDDWLFSKFEIYEERFAG